MNSINLNGMPLINSIEEINFSDLEVGNQMLILNEEEFEAEIQTEDGEHCYKNIKCNHIENVMLQNISNILYTFNCFELNIDRDLSYDTNEEQKIYLLLDLEKNIKLKIKGYSHHCCEKDDEDGFDDNELKILNTFKDMVDSFTRSKRVINKEGNIYKINLLLTIPIDYGYVCCDLYNSITPSLYRWNKNTNVYIINKDFTEYYYINCNIDKIFEKIKQLDCVKYMYDFDNFNKIYFPAHKYNINDYIKDPSILYTICNAFASVYGGPSSEEITQYFEPIYIDESMKFKAYMHSLEMWDDKITYTYDTTLGGYSFRDTEPFKDNIRKANAIMCYLRKSSIINVYTGEPIESTKYSYKKEYEDYSGFILMKIDPKYNSVYYDYYTLLDNIYIKANEKEKQELINRKQVMTTLLESK